MNKKIILSVIAGIILITIIYQVAFKKEESDFALAEVVKGAISQEVSETGQVEKGDKISLNFKNSGRIENIFVEVGENVKAGESLAKLETSELSIQLQEAKANLSLTQAKLDKLLAGSTKEEIQIYETAVENAEISLSNAQVDLKNAEQNYTDTETSGEETLKQAQDDALNVLDAAYLESYDAKNTIAALQTTYFLIYDQEGVEIRNSKEKIETSVSQISFYINEAKADSTQENIDLALSETKEEMSNISDEIEAVQEICEGPDYREEVSSTHKTSLGTHRTSINTAITNITSSQQTISSAELTNEINLNTAQTSIDSAQNAVNTAEGSLKSAQDSLAQIKATPRQEDVDLYQAQVDQAQAQVKILENKIAQAYLRSPVNGQIIEIKKRIGELAQATPQDVVIVFLPDDPFKIEVDIYEEDVVKIKIDNPVDVSLIAFPGQLFKGKVISIDPAEKLIDGVVYYKVIIALEELLEGVKPGMTADLIIKTALKEDVLIIPEEAVQNKDDKTIVEVLKNGDIEEREVEIGLEGSDDMVEVVSGLEEGEKVILK